MTFPDWIGSDLGRDIAVTTAIRKSSSRQRRPAMLFGCLLASFITASCSDRVTSPTGATAGIVSSVNAANEASFQNLARAVAVALRDSATRASVFAAWRSSEFTEHKLVLQTFCNSPEGLRLLESIGPAFGGTEAARSAMQALPELDFYLPFREHRMTWRGAEDVLVAATTDRRHTPILLAIDTDGRSVALRRSDGVPSRPLLLLHAAEPKSHRVDRQADVAGPVIQDADDGEVSGVVTTFLPNGDSTVRELADILPSRRSGIRGSVSTDGGLATRPRGYIEECGDSCGGGGTSGPIDTTYIHSFFINYETDTWEWGNHEVEFWAYLYYDQIFPPGKMAFAKYRRDGIYNWYPYGADHWVTQTNEPGVPLFIGPRLRYAPNDYMSIVLKEVDAFNWTTAMGQNFWPVGGGSRPFCEAGCVYNPIPVTYRGGAELKYTRHTGP